MQYTAAQRFTGIRALYGEEGFDKLQHARVLVAGTGGVGSWICEALCRTGVGSLMLIDPDTIEIKNSNRQLHTLNNTVGLYKAEVLADRLRAINPEVKLEVVKELLTPDNIPEILANVPHYAADAIDDTAAKAALINYLYRQKCCFIVSGGAGARVDPDRLHVADMSKARGNGLIKHMRDILRREYNFPSGGAKMGIKCCFSEEQPHYCPVQDGSLPKFGASMPVTASAGLKMAAYLINRIVSD